MFSIFLSRRIRDFIRVKRNFWKVCLCISTGSEILEHFFIHNCAVLHCMGAFWSNVTTNDNLLKFKSTLKTQLRLRLPV